MQNNNRALILEYGKKKGKIKRRLKEFKIVWNQPDDKIFSELCFCICTPQSRAVYYDKAISRLEGSRDLYGGGLKQIRAGLTAVRFPNNKARYIVEARRLFSDNGTIKIKDRIDTKNIYETRQWFADNVKGLGLKESSHFLRNIGFGSNLAILDVHILKNMARYNVISQRPKSITKTRYLSLEEKLKEFSKEINIPMDELDLLFWSSETGEIFK